MNPGPELDRVIAEKIFGLEIKGKVQTGDEYELGLRWGREGYVYQKGPNLEELIPEYSTDIAAASELLEKIKQIECKEDRYAGPYIESNNGNFEWYLCYRWHELEYLNVSSKSLPHAICLFALKVIDEILNVPYI